MNPHSVVVTGAGSGIGRAIASQLSKEGYYVYLVGRSVEKLRETQNLCPTPTQVLAIDLSSDQAQLVITQALETQQKKFPLIALVNNAAIFHRLPFSETSLDIWELQFQNTLLSAVRTTKACLPYLKKSKGSVVNISSTLGSRPVKDTSAYSAMKAALNNWTQSLALELAPDGVRVNGIEPGLVDTPIHDFHATTSQDLRKQLDALQPLGRMGQPEDIAGAVSFLLRPQSSWITGALLPVDGGISL